LRVAVTNDYPDAEVKAGDTIYILHYIGKGYWNGWHDGQVVEIDNLPNEGSKPKTTWWVKLKTSSGVICWTLDRRNFENQDACE